MQGNIDLRPITTIPFYIQEKKKSDLSLSCVQAGFKFGEHKSLKTKPWWSKTWVSHNSEKLKGALIVRKQIFKVLKENMSKILY